MHGNNGRRRRLAKDRRALACTTRVRRDGNAWMATREGFIDLQASIAGFGGSPTEARNNLVKNEADPAFRRTTASEARSGARAERHAPTEPTVSTVEDLSGMFNALRGAATRMREQPAPKLTPRERYLQRQRRSQ